MQFLFRKPSMPDPTQTLPGRSEAVLPPASRTTSTAARSPRPTPTGSRSPTSRMGCFWGAEKAFWSAPGRVGHGRRLPGRHHAQPDVPESCTGKTGHAEAVRVVYDPKVVSLRAAAADRSGRTTTRRRATARATTSAPSTGRRSSPTRRSSYATAIGVPRHVPAGADEGGLRHDHDRDPRGAGVLLRRGLPPAVPREGPQRLLPEPSDGRGACPTSR